MAGRGTDIVLGEGVTDLGGLHVMGTERHESRRIDNQLRGRSGRQGDPGASRFYLSLEDELMRLFGSERISGMMQTLGMQEGEDIQHPWINKAIENAQRKVEGMNFDIRKQLIEYDNVMNKQREAVYRLRNEILDGEDVTQTITDMLQESIDQKVTLWAPEKVYPEQWDIASLDAWLARTFNTHLEIEQDTLVQGKVDDAYSRRAQELTIPMLHHLQRMILLQMIDTAWKEHLYDLDQVKKGIGLRAYGQKDPKIEYQRESFALFEQMMAHIRETTVEYIFKFRLAQEPFRRRPVVQTAESREPVLAGTPDARTQRPVASNNEVLPAGLGGQKQKTVTIPDKIGRNDPCPCGSGKKYKKCCGK